MSQKKTTSALVTHPLIEKIIHTVPALIVVYNIKNGQYIFVSDALAQLLGYAKEAFLKGGLSFASSIVHPEDLQRIAEENNAALKKANSKKRSHPADETIVTFEYRMRHKNGSWRWLHSDGVVFARDKKGQVELVMNVSVDITERKKLETSAVERIIESEERFRTLTSHAPVGIFLTDENGDCLFVNERWLQYAGLSQKQAMGRGWIKALHPEDKDRVFREWYAVAKKGTDFISEYRFKATHGAVTWLSGSAVGLERDGKIKGYIGTITDITERKSLESQKDEFMNIVSHELKTPVTSLKAYEQVLQQQFIKAKDYTSAGYLMKMDTQLNRLTDLINDLLDVTKIERGMLMFNDRFFDMNELIEETVEEMQRTTDKHAIVKKLSKTRILFGDRDRIGQVIINFISNAIKYSPDGKKIIVKSLVSKTHIEVSVQDFGVGMKQEDILRIFERFYRVGGEKRETFPGLGLGLYISAEIIKRSRGKIWAESKKGKGSTFYFSLPIRKKKAV